MSGPIFLTVDFGASCTTMHRVKSVYLWCVLWLDGEHRLPPVLSRYVLSNYEEQDPESTEEIEEPVTLELR